MFGSISLFGLHDSQCIPYILSVLPDCLLITVLMNGQISEFLASSERACNNLRTKNNYEIEISDNLHVSVSLSVNITLTRVYFPLSRFGKI